MKKLLALLLAATAVASAQEANAAQTNSTLNLTVTLVATCKIQSLGAMNFGTNGVLDVAKTATSTLGVQCTNTTPFTISFSGTAAVNSVAGRMAKAAEFVNYTATLSATSGTGNGALQSFTINGNIPVQNTPSPGVYAGTQTVYVTY